MSISSTLLSEYDHEMANTRKVLERIPDDKFDWRPHAKSMPLGALAIHVARLAELAGLALTTESFDRASGAWQNIELHTREEILAVFDRNTVTARAAIAGASDEALAQMWSMRNGEQVYFTLPRAAVLRTMFFNHLIHHRAQLEVYLRLNDIPLPPVYGPTADEKM